MNQNAKSTAIKERPRRTLRFLFFALLAWGLLIAAGTVLTTDQFDIRKPLFVMGTMGGFLGLWLTALWVKDRRSARHSEVDRESVPSGEQPPG